MEAKNPDWEQRTTAIEAVIPIGRQGVEKGPNHKYPTEDKAKEDGKTHCDQKEKTAGECKENTQGSWKTGFTQGYNGQRWEDRGGERRTQRLRQADSEREQSGSQSEEGTGAEEEPNSRKDWKEIWELDKLNYKPRSRTH